MARREKPIPATGTLLAALAGDLRELRRKKKMTYKDMAEQCDLVGSTLSQAANGVNMPTWETVETYVAVCGEQPAQWRERYLKAEAEYKSGSAGVTNQAGDATVVRLDTRRRTGTTGPAPVPFTATTVKEFLEGLDAVRNWAGRPSLREISRRSDNLLPATTLHYMLTNENRTLPRRENVTAFLTACGVDQARLREWSIVWERIANEQSKRLRGSNWPDVG